MKSVWSVIVALWISTLWGLCDFAVEQTAMHTHETTGITLLSGEVALPTGTDWMLTDPLPSVAGLSDMVLIPPEEYYTLRQGRRQRLAAEKQHRQRNRGTLRSLYWSLRRYAEAHDGRAPARLSALEAEHWTRADRTNTFHYIPNVLLLHRAGTNWWEHAPVTLVAFETKPSVDDGKHWQLMSDGTVHLVDIAPSLLAAHGVELIPGAKPVAEQMQHVPQTLTFRIAAIRRGSPPDIVTLHLTNTLTDTQHKLHWDLTQPETDRPDPFKAWAEERMWTLDFMDQGEGASVLTYWVATMARQYGIKAPHRQAGNRGRNNRQASLFNVLGGRAAIRETLQLQAMFENANDPSNQTRTDIATLTGVTVKSHPFADMLGDREGGSLVLADLAPPDRLFAYFAHPKALLQLMDGGTDFVFRGGVSATGRSLEYRITERYLEKLGISEPWVRRLMNSGAVKELAVMLPDLFLVDGTDVTVACRLGNPRLAAAALALLGLDELNEVQMIRTTAYGDAAYWAQRDDLLLVSTQRSELDRVLTLIANPADSLGQSAEFRYMLSRQPVQPETRAYIYFSDPFVRHLVGPAVKIGQLRRLRARTELEAIAAGHLLYQADGHTKPATIGDLVERGYVPALRQVKDAVLHEDGTVSSQHYGSLKHLATLLDRPVSEVTDTEAQAYQGYVERYNRFWRRFFDPIGIRLDQVSDHEMALSVFILPLIDNSIYAGLREALIDGNNTAPLALPALDPRPVATLSFNLTETVWTKVAGEMDRTFEQMLGIRPDILDHLGPDVHVAMGDADPIISLGSGELTGLAGIVGGRGSDMFFIPVMVSMLTRPCVLMVGLDNPDAVRAKLRGMTTGSISDNSMFFRSTGSLYQLAGRDAWHYILNLGGMLNLRFGIEIKDRFLVISNLPFSYNPSVLSWNEAPRNAAALQLDPAACSAQLPALYASATSRQRLAAMSGLGALYPMLRSGADTVAAAIEAHRHIFGYAPRHPGRGHWTWDGQQLSSSVFGYPGHEMQPPYDPDDKAFGIFQGIRRVGLSMQFEDDGLRSYCHWRLMPVATKHISRTEAESGNE